MRRRRPATVTVGDVTKFLVRPTVLSAMRPEHRWLRLVDWLFRNRETGRFTVAQFPNVALGLFVVCRIAQALVARHGIAHGVLHWSAVAALLWWALDELLRGVNPFRRILGAAVLASLVS